MTIKRKAKSAPDNAALLAAIRKEIRALAVVPVPVPPAAPVAVTVAPAPQIPVDDFNNSVLYKLGKIESLLGEVNSGLIKHVEDDEVAHRDMVQRLGLVEKAVPEKLDTRLRSMERSRTYVVGAGAALGFVVTMLTNFLYHFVKSS